MREIFEMVYIEMMKWHKVHKDTESKFSFEKDAFFRYDSKKEAFVISIRG
jgi:hypothetical protein